MKRRVRAYVAAFEGADPYLVGAVGVLLFIGSFVVWGAGSYSRLASTSPLGQHYVVAKHLFMIGVGTVALLVLQQADYRLLRRRWLNWGLLAVAYGLVALTLRGDREINRWITVFGFSVQPVEVAKLLLVAFLAERLGGQSGRRPPDVRRLAAALGLGVLPLAVMLVLQPNYGNILVLAGVTLVALFVAETPLRWLGPMVAVPAVGMAVAFRVVDKLHIRLQDWLDGLRHGDYTYQVTQSLIGLGAGGWRGLGVGQSHNKFAFLPESHTDFAFSVLGEEWGLFGTLPVILMLVIIAWRGYGIAARAVEPFGRILAAGVTTALTIYGIANIGMVTGLLPVIGVPLPFVSYGGTAMVAALASVGILLSVDRVAKAHELWKARWDRGGAA
ncbi:MAG: FtsW/RodA/SpoVE family cell cycle protein [bacterium]|nr:FtsW/RodA/SpoVE family cell cycle protein [bacterium]